MALQEAGRTSGDLTFPLPYSPELHFGEFKSVVADMKNAIAVSVCSGCRFYITTHWLFKSVLLYSLGYVVFNDMHPNGRCMVVVRVMYRAIVIQIVHSPSLAGSLQCPELLWRPLYRVPYWVRLSWCLDSH